MSEIKLHGVTKLGLKNIIDFIYTSKVNLDMGNLQDTLEAANFLQVMPVLRFCNRLLISEVRLRGRICWSSSSLIRQSPLLSDVFAPGINYPLRKQSPPTRPTSPVRSVFSPWFSLCVDHRR